jgi:hypothetical protein
MTVDAQYGEVLIPSPNSVFSSTFVYASVRQNDTTKGDSIAIISLQQDGKMELVSQFFTGLTSIQGMQFGGDNDRYLVAGAASAPGGVIVLERVGKGDNFTKVGTNNEGVYTTFAILPEE